MGTLSEEPTPPIFSLSFLWGRWGGGGGGGGGGGEGSTLKGNCLLLYEKIPSFKNKHPFSKALPSMEADRKF